MRNKLWIFFCGVLLGWFQLAHANEKGLSTCAQWKKICYEKAHCIHKTGLRSGCYRCLKPGKNSVHLSLREIDRSTCNPHTAEYFRTMGYHCYHPEGSDIACSRTVKSQYCVWRCASR